MSHEIRTPMNTILGFAETLLEDDKTDTEREQDLQVIRRNGQHLISIINSILDMSKLDSGEMSVESIPMSLTEVVDDVARLMRFEAVRKDVQFYQQYEYPIPEAIMSDPMRIRQILLNLISNAVKFTAEGSVTLQVACDNNGETPVVKMRITDTGIGMTPEQIDKVFQPFTQADASITRQFGGTGLGLSIVKRLVEMMDGTIEVRSVPGGGTTFDISIRIECEEAAPEVYGSFEDFAAERGPDESFWKKKGGSVRILVVEDGPDNIRLITHHLKKAGAEFVVAKNGLEAIEVVANAAVPFDVILMDMQMPMMDGYTATGKLREDGYWRPIIAVTAHAMSGDREECLAAGCDDYLTKPIDRKKLIETCMRHVKKQADIDLNAGDKTGGVLRGRAA